MHSFQNDALIPRILAEKSAICSRTSLDGYPQVPFCTVSVRLIHAHKNCIVKKKGIVKNKRVNDNMCNKHIRKTKEKYSYGEYPLWTTFCLKYVFRNKKYVFLNKEKMGICDLNGYLLGRKSLAGKCFKYIKNSSQQVKCTYTIMRSELQTTILGK